MPLVVYVLALGTFLMGTTEFVVAGLLPEITGDLQVSVAQTGLMITVFAVGMIVGAPLMAMLTLRLPKQLTLMLALGVFAAGHVIVALSSNFTLVLAARFLTAIATGAFWAVANVAAARAAGPAASSRALGLVGAGAMLANVVGVPLGAFAGQAMGWRGPFWALAALAAAAIALIARTVPHDGGDAQTVSMALAVRFARQAPVLASALTVSAFNLGTAIGSWIAGLTLDTSLGTTGPAVVGTVIAALTLIPTTALVLAQRRRSAVTV
ncbi:MFS transporter [Streptomyces avermitilis]|uniref:MFS transporter n=1 Tax=Streptomyces avermitilis TaxID=33903 RepID=UPI0033C47005